LLLLSSFHSGNIPFLQIAREVIAALLIMLFLYAGLSKWLDFRTFIGEMNNQPFPKGLIPFLVWAIPSLEITIVIALVIERTRMVGLYTSFVFMTLFTTYASAILLHFFAYIPCSCGGLIRRLSWRQHLVFNFFFVILSITGIILQHRKSSKTNLITKNSFV